MSGLLTPDELEVLKLSARLYNALKVIVGDGQTRKSDLQELSVHIHAIQYTVMAQAVARAYPDQLRLLGE